MSDDLPLIATGRYSTYRPVVGVPVRTTVGEPKFWRGPALEFVRELAPFGIFPRLTGDAARTAYLSRLDRHADAIIATLADIARRHPGRQLCLLCYEDVHAGESCHRRWAASWLEERHGVEVPELPELIDGDEPNQLRLPF